MEGYMVVGLPHHDASGSPAHRWIWQWGIYRQALRQTKGHRKIKKPKYIQDKITKTEPKNKTKKQKKTKQLKRSQKGRKWVTQKKRKWRLQWTSGQLGIILWVITLESMQCDAVGMAVLPSILAASTRAGVPSRLFRGLQTWHTGLGGLLRHQCLTSLTHKTKQLRKTNKNQKKNKKKRIGSRGVTTT